jgi:hypothetical protein
MASRMDDDVIYEPEFNIPILPAICECGDRFQDEVHLSLHKRETCPRRFDPSFKHPSRVPAWFELPGSGGVADGGRKT